MQIALPPHLTQADFPSAGAQHAMGAHCIRSGLCSSDHSHHCKDHVKLLQHFVIPYSIFQGLLGSSHAALFFFFPAGSISVYLKNIFLVFQSEDVLNVVDLKML